MRDSEIASKTTIDRAAQRIALLGKPFPLTGIDIKGRPLRPTKKSETMVIFWSPNQQSSLDALEQIHESSRYNQWTTDFLVVSSSKIGPEGVALLDEKLSHFHFLDHQTSKDWIEKIWRSEISLFDDRLTKRESSNASRHLNTSHEQPDF